MSNVEILVHPITKMPKHCFPSPDGSGMFCNFTVRNGLIWRFAKYKDFLKFLFKLKKKKGQEDDQKLIQKKNEQLSTGARSSN